MKSKIIKLTRAVKQEDLMSSYVFNLFMDEFLTSLPAECGLKFAEDRIAALAYADDFVLLTKPRRDNETLLKKATTFFSNRRLEINGFKCLALVVDKLGKKFILNYQDQTLYESYPNSIDGVIQIQILGTSYWTYWRDACGNDAPQTII